MSFPWIVLFWICILYKVCWQHLRNMLFEGVEMEYDWISKNKEEVLLNHNLFKIFHIIDFS